MKINFYVRFSTQFGQRLFLSGNLEQLGNLDLENALPMSYLNETFWHISIEIDHMTKMVPEIINYKYLLKDEQDDVVVEWGDDREIELKKITAEEIMMVDTWNHAGEFENAFFSAPFQEVLLDKTRSPIKPAPYRGNTHIFKVKAPLLQKNEALCILGNNATLGDWQTNEPLLMSKEKNWWTIKLNFSKESFPIAYKYGIYNTRLKTFVRFEDGDNRLLLDNLNKKKVTISHDGFVHMPNNVWRGAGVAIPVFSLRSNNSMGIGEFLDLKLLVDWARKIGLKLIQILPVNDTISTHTWEDSYPYKAISAFALHPIYLNLDSIAGKDHQSVLKGIRKKQKLLNDLPEIDYEQVMNLKWGLIQQLYGKLRKDVFASEDYKVFFEENKSWLEPYAAFSFLRDKFKTSDYSAWKENKNFDPKSISKLIAESQDYFDEIGIYYFVQYHLHLQLKEATAYGHKWGVILKGDIPIGVNRYSADAWQDPGLFHMDMQAGAPPDDFALRGQNWGFPTYYWEKMEEDGFEWWHQRFQQMSMYYDAFRIDHILGFFRIWTIPIHAVEGIMGHFVPSIPVHINEFGQNGISFDYYRYCKPFITEYVLKEMLGDDASIVKSFLQKDEDGTYSIKDLFSTQRRIEKHFDGLPKNDQNNKIRTALFDLVSNVILFEQEGSKGTQFHFRFDMNQTLSFKHLDHSTQENLKRLYINYYFRRQDHFWAEQAMHKLPALKRSTNMLVCGEDLGLVPHCVPDIMKQLGILSLEIQRMPKDINTEFFDPANAPYLSVVTPSTHDMSTIRGWWEEDRAKTQRFFNNHLKHPGEAPFYCEAWINKAIVIQHLYSPAMWSIFQLQDLMGIDGKLRRENPDDERINIPANPKHYWRYRMHLTLEQLLKENDLIQELKSYIHTSGRN
ncbi:MAG: 4-alpha-glucanotransferase [Bacteroidetes bacterium]|nr:MAG: 4-alpha-glucanotransferase [Bacteroidota bacterium]